MKIKQLLTKTLLVAVGLLVGQSVWGAITETVVVNQDFNDGQTTLFTGVSRITVSNDANNNNVKFTCANNSQNGYSLATYDFSSAIGEDATAVKIEFLFWIPNQNAAYRRFFTVGQADLRTGFSQHNYSTTGSMFAFGLARISSANYFSINGASTTAEASAGSVLGAWARAEIYVDNSEKKVNYKITNVENTTTYYSANGVNFVDGSASYCNQLDFFDCQNNTVSYLDNLVITKYVDDSKQSTTYTVKYQDAEGTDLKDPAVYNIHVGDNYSASASDMATFYNNDESKKYIYKTGNTTTQASSTAANNVITLVFDVYEKVNYSVTAKDGENTLGSLASGEAYTDGSTSVYWNKFMQYDNKWYETTGQYGIAITKAGDNVVNFSPSNIAYFFEFETLSRSGGSNTVTETSSSYSNNKVGRAANSSGSYATLYTTALVGGDYNLYMPYFCGNGVDDNDKVYVYVTDDLDNLGDPVKTFSIQKTNTGNFSATITVPQGYYVALQGAHSYSHNSKARIDYLTLTPSVTATIGEAGWATLYSPYTLDFAKATPSGLKAYTATTDGAKVTLTPVDNVPANTGVVLEASAGNYSIPVIASSETEKGDLEGNATAATAFDAFDNYTLYILTLLNNGDVQFNPCKSGEIAAGKAFLKVAIGAAKALSVMFANDPTGIANVNAAEVAQPIKRIVNGQLVIEKNGKRYNAAGAEF